MKPFDESKYYLGTLCCRGHDYEGTGKSLRRFGKYPRICGKCLECGRVISFKHRDRRNTSKRLKRRNNPEETHAIDLRYYKKNSERIRAIRREQYNKNPKACIEATNRWVEAHRDERSRYERDRYREMNRTLGDPYIKVAIRNQSGIGFADITPELIELKRTQLKAHRASQAYKKGELNEYKTNSKESR